MKSDWGPRPRMGLKAPVIPVCPTGQNWLPVEAKVGLRSAEESMAFFEDAAKVLDFVQNGGDKREVSTWYQPISSVGRNARKNQLGWILDKKDREIELSFMKDSSTPAPSAFELFFSTLKR